MCFACQTNGSLGGTRISFLGRHQSTRQSMRQSTSIHVNPCQSTSIDVNRRQSMSIYVNLRQFTLIYVNLCQSMSKKHISDQNFKKGSFFKNKNPPEASPKVGRMGGDTPKWVEIPPNWWDTPKILSKKNVFRIG